MGTQHLPTGCVWDWRQGPGTASERQHLRAMLDTLPPRSLVVADAGFVGSYAGETSIRPSRRSQARAWRVAVRRPPDS